MLIYVSELYLCAVTQTCFLPVIFENYVLIDVLICTYVTQINFEHTSGIEHVY